MTLAVPWMDAVAVALCPTPVFGFSGSPGQLLFQYAAGTTGTKIDTFTDSTGLTPNPNPLQLDANGNGNVWLTVGTGYKLTLSPSTDSDPPTNPIWTVDGIFAPTPSG